MGLKPQPLSKEAWGLDFSPTKQYIF